MTLIGKVERLTDAEVEAYALMYRGRPVPLRGSGKVAPYVGQRIRVEGRPYWDRARHRSMFRVDTCTPTGDADQFYGVVEGTVRAINQNHPNRRGTPSACVFIQQGKDQTTRLRITALDSYVGELNVSALSIGDYIRVGGYLATHPSGLHVLFREYVKEEVV